MNLLLETRGGGVEGKRNGSPVPIEAVRGLVMGEHDGEEAGEAKEEEEEDDDAVEETEEELGELEELDDAVAAPDACNLLLRRGGDGEDEREEDDDDMSLCRKYAGTGMPVPVYVCMKRCQVREIWI